MFDLVLRHDLLPRPRYGSGTVIAAAFYAGVVWFGAWAQHRTTAIDRQDMMVTFVSKAPPPRVTAPPAPPKAPAVPTPQQGPKLSPKAMESKPVTVLAQAIVAPTEIPAAVPAEAEPTADLVPTSAEAEGGSVDLPAVPGGIVNPVVDASVFSGTGEGGGGTVAPEFDARMTPPVFVSGPSPRYTEKAIEREVEGTMEVRCVVTIDGQVQRCQVVRSLPFMDRAVIDALERRRYRPATLAGRPIEVYYRFRIPLRLE
jgi:protein TonB